MPLATVWLSDSQPRHVWVSPEEIREGATEVSCPDCDRGQVDDQPCGRCDASGLVPVAL